MGTQERVTAKPESFFQNAEMSENNPWFVIAQILVKRGVPLIISKNAHDAYGRELPDYVAIHATTDKARDIFYHVLYRPEFRAIEALREYAITPGPYIEESGWDELTKRRFWRSFWQNRKGVTRGNIVFDQKNVNRQIAEYSDVEALNLEDIRSLLEEVVDRELASS